MVDYFGTPILFMDLLCTKLRITNLESFLEFFQESPGIFLERVPLPIDDIRRHKEHWFVASMMADYFTTEIHAGEEISTYAWLYDDAQYPKLKEYLDMLAGAIEGYMEHLLDTAWDTYDVSFQAAMDRLHGLAPKMDSLSISMQGLEEQFLLHPQHRRQKIRLQHNGHPLSNLCRTPGLSPMYRRMHGSADTLNRRLER
jgi:hypothetical protein